MRPLLEIIVRIQKDKRSRRRLDFSPAGAYGARGLDKDSAATPKVLLRQSP
jgi:hypothetical protein